MKYQINQIVRKSANSGFTVINPEAANNVMYPIEDKGAN
jgi:hypothetical protein